MDRIANRLFMVATVTIFAWTWTHPAVSLGHFATPVVQYTGLALSMWFAGGLILFCLALIRQAMGGVKAGVAADQDRFAFLKEWIAQQSRTRFLNVITPLLAFVVTMASFTVHKTVVLPLAGFDWDTRFITLDRALFLGQDPWVLSHAVFGSARATWVVDQFYHAWFYPMIIAYVLCALMTRGTLARACYIGTFLVSWFVIGCVLAGLLASAGPVYEGALFEAAGQFDPLKARLTEQAAAVEGIASQVFQAELLSGYEAGKVGLGYGISAMPSMHVALAAMWALLFFGINRWLGVAGVAYTIFIWIGSVHLGWHYAADGIASSALVVLIWGALRWMILRLTSDATARDEDLQKIPGE